LLLSGKYHQIVVGQCGSPKNQDSKRIFDLGKRKNRLMDERSTCHQFRASGSFMTSISIEYYEFYELLLSHRPIIPSSESSCEWKWSVESFQILSKSLYIIIEIEQQ
jgi:hypothetical protein